MRVTSMQETPGSDLLRNAVEWGEILLYAIAMVSGGLGGCAAAVNQGMSRGVVKASMVIAYMLVGMVSGLLMISYASIILGKTYGMAEAVGHSIVGGMVAATLLGSGHVTIRAVLKRINWEVTITARRRNEERRQRDDEDADEHARY